MIFAPGTTVLTPSVTTATVIESNYVVTTIEFSDGSRTTYPSVSLEGAE